MSAHADPDLPPIADPEAARIVHRAVMSMRVASGDLAKLRAVRDAARQLDPVTQSDAFDHLTSVAADMFGLMPGDIQAALAAGARDRDDARAASAGKTGAPGADGWPEPDMRLVEDDRVPAPPLDDDALPAGWADWITREAAACGCPRDYVAGALIGAASAWIGNARRIAATADWNEAAVLWFALIGAPSAGKTPALRQAINTSWQLERDAEPAWREAMARYERDAETASARDKAWRDDVREAAAAGRTPPNRPHDAEAPTQPPRPRVIAMDVSIEELQRMLAEEPRGLLYPRDELAGWLGSFDRYNGAGSDRAFYLEAWNGGRYSNDRVRYHGAPIRIEHASLAIIGGMVPDRLREVLAGADDGLTARLLYVWPEALRIAPLADSGDADASRRRAMLAEAARRLRGLAMGADDDGTPAPKALHLDTDAFVLFDDVRRDAMEKARIAHGLAAGWQGKNPGRALRLALVYELLTWAARDGSEPARVSADSVARSAAYLDYAADMLDRVTAGLALTQAEADAAAIARYLATSKPARVNEREVYQAPGFRWARETDRRTAALAVLDRAGWIRRPQTAIRGRPRGDWQVSPRIITGASQ